MSGQPAVGAYGLALDGVDAAASLLIPAAPAWPRFSVSNTAGQIERITDRLSDDRAEIALRSGGMLFVDRLQARAEFVTPELLSPDELAHPGLAPVAAVTARWLGRQSFHAGAFAVGTDVWALLADREGGKSTTLAWLASRGHPIVCDDMLVLDGDEPLAGPRILDLRAESAQRLGLGDYRGRVGARERWRVQLDDMPPGTRFRGWVFLHWSDDVDVEPVRPGERLPRLAEHLGLRVPPARPDRLLELAALPGWEFRRPRGWDRFDEAGDRLLEALAG
ncbi:MAG TPA: hypothetical protein VNP89_04155 [Gaiellaceae bacterium]|nr:hypothetical protein [Gaiellaceae bacterium]